MMTMKKIMIGMAILLAVQFSACSDWISVSPKQEVESDKLFDSEIGFKNALIGVYARMTLNASYGKQMSYGSIEKLVQRYDNYDASVAPTDNQRATIYNYKNNSDAKAMVNGLWSELFRTIANINSLLTRLDEEGREIVTTDGYWELMKGEALGLRAFHYFDLLRLYGPVYSENPNLKCLPWRTEFNADRKELLPANVIADSILNDLKRAEALLKDDPLTFGDDPSHLFMSLRKHRMNRMAVKALQARVYLWIGDKTQAGRIAREVIDECGMSLVRNNIDDVSMYDETLFCLGMDDMAEKVKSDWADLTAFSSELYISTGNAESVFERLTVGVNDIRYKSGYGFIHGKNGLLCRKYLGKAVMYSEKVPLIRLVEMYYILAESVSLEESVSLINEVRNARGISRNFNLVFNAGYDEDARVAALNKEYQKEFFAEGQWFYFLKRHNCPTFHRCPVAKMVYYVLPTPEDEVEYGI